MVVESRHRHVMLSNMLLIQNHYLSWSVQIKPEFGFLFCLPLIFFIWIVIPSSLVVSVKEIYTHVFCYMTLQFLLEYTEYIFLLNQLILGLSMCLLLTSGIFAYRGKQSLKCPFNSLVPCISALYHGKNIPWVVTDWRTWIRLNFTPQPGVKPR